MLQGSSVYPRVQNKALRRGICREPDDQEKVCVASSSVSNDYLSSVAGESFGGARTSPSLSIHGRNKVRSAHYLDPQASLNHLQLVTLYTASILISRARIISCQSSYTDYVQQYKHSLGGGSTLQVLSCTWSLSRNSRRSTSYMGRHIPHSRGN